MLCYALYLSSCTGAFPLVWWLETPLVTGGRLGGGRGGDYVFQMPRHPIPSH
jgi:hypothetical protein